MRLPSLSVADAAGPQVRTASLLKPSATAPSKYITDRISPFNLFFPCLEHHQAIKAGCRTPPLHLAPKQRTDVVPRRPRSSRSPSRPPLQAARLPRFILGSVFA
jgi:hypothetical protein